ncbi:hypothetical protein GF340_05680 [Candidatus Peregrinibacteria bacterium]|nr:hypothetical protein [Candidatus Peregrinibacteria bacterium]
MKDFIKKFVFGTLKMLAKIRLKRLRLFVIGITGSIGKTSTKDAIATVLSSKYKISKSDKSFNTEFGMPLAILGQESGFSSASKWTKILLSALYNAFFGGRDIQIMILEMGVDKPGDMDLLLNIVKPQVGIFTNVKPVHLDEGQFKDLEDIFNEKKKLLVTLPEKGTAIMNLDDPYVSLLKDKLHSKVLTYGFSEMADLRVSDVKHSMEGLAFTISYKDETVTSSIALLGAFQVYVILPAIAAALTQGFSLEEAVEALKEFKLPPGRMNPIPGIKDSLIIDSSYNASPEAVKNAIDILTESPGRKIAVIGNMNELGDYTIPKHREVGMYMADKVDMFFTVGEYAKASAEAAIEKGFSDKNVFSFQDPIEASKKLHTIIAPGDTILVKGSQNKVRLEKLVKKIMKEPERANELLARQGSEWEKIN